jgi:hypothetical protein
MQSLVGVRPLNHPDQRPWIKFEDWPEDAYPLRKSFNAAQRMPRVPGEYAWIRAEGEGVYEIPVGPVHAGIIEPARRSSILRRGWDTSIRGLRKDLRPFPGRRAAGLRDGYQGTQQ